MSVVCRTLLPVALLAVAVVALPAQHLPSKVFTGANGGDKLGEALAAVPDVNGDGRPEFVVGAFRADAPGNPPLVDAGAAYLYDGATFRRLHTVYGEKANGRLGYAVAGVPDVDGDGKGDVILGAPRHDGVGSWSGRVYVLSGATGQIIRKLDGAVATAQLGYSVAGLEDLNGDGRGELLIAAYGQNGRMGRDTGRVFLISGGDGRLLHEWQGEGPNHYLGNTVARVPDVDGDGRNDILIGAYHYAPATSAAPIVDIKGVPTTVASGSRWGRAYLYSGGTRALIRTHTGENAGDLFATTVAGVPDVNGDGRGDYLVGAEDFDPPGRANAGRAYLFSGKDGARLAVFDGQKAYDHLGRNVAGVPDLDGDGRGDLLITAYKADGKIGFDAGVVELRSGATASLLCRFEGEGRSDFLGWGTAGIGDLNGDGRGDVLLGAYAHTVLPKINAGRAYVHTGGLVGDRQSLSVAQGGTVNLTIDAGPANRGRLYLVLASLAGNEPGVTLPRVHFPVTPDNLFMLSYLMANSPIFTRTLGPLDTAGRARAAFNAPAGLLQGLQGKSLTFGYVLVPALDVASNPVGVQVLP